MKLILLILVAAVTTSASAQSAPTDQEITAAHTACYKPDHFVAPTMENPKFTMREYKPEWQSCVAIDAEYLKRQLAQQAKEKADKATIDETAKKLAPNN